MSKEVLRLNELEVATVNNKVNNARKAYDCAKSAATNINTLLRAGYADRLSERHSDKHSGSQGDGQGDSDSMPHSNTNTAQVERTNSAIPLSSRRSQRSRRAHAFGCNLHHDTARFLLQFDDGA